MKKNIKRRKLQIRSETLNVLRVLQPDDLREANVVGASEPNCCPGAGSSCPTTNSQTH
jgi:hypothetical protein